MGNIHAGKVNRSSYYLEVIACRDTSKVIGLVRLVMVALFMLGGFYIPLPPYPEVQLGCMKHESFVPLCIFFLLLLGSLGCYLLSLFVWFITKRIDVVR